VKSYNLVRGDLMEEKYECENCGKTVKVSTGSTPKCCGKAMKKLDLDVCLQPAHAEHARPMNNEEACDDGRAG
jgi:hypothetical protein